VPDSPSVATVKISVFRRLTNSCATLFAIAAAVLVILPLMAIFLYLLIKGVQSLNWAFLTQLPKPPGEVGGGMANAIVGSGIILAMASLVGIPVGIGCGIYLAEYGRNAFGDVVRFTSDVLNGVPSIVIGIAVYSLIVVRQKHFSAFAGSAALAIMMVPTVARATEEMLLMVPNNIREAALGLGIPKWRTTLSISLRTASRAWQEKRPRCCSPPWVISTGAGVLISRRQHCRCKSIPTPCRPTMTGTNKLGPGR